MSLLLGPGDCVTIKQNMKHLTELHSLNTASCYLRLHSKLVNPSDTPPHPQSWKQSDGPLCPQSTL